MKNTWKKFHLNLSTYFFFLISFLCGYFKQTLFIFFIVFVHECGHILMIHLCKYKFLKVEFYPFGGMTTIDKPINSSINKEILIAFSGVAMQGILGIILFFLHSNKIFYFENYDLFQTYNFTIFFFNILPIIPLDGSVIMHSIMEKLFSFEQSFFFYEVISILFLLLFFLFNYFFQIDNYFICFVLLSEFFLLRKQKKYIIHRFYLERTIGNYPYKKIKNERDTNIHSLKKETLHFFLKESKYVHEREMLQKKFLKNRDFTGNSRKRIDSDTVF